MGAKAVGARQQVRSCPHRTQNRAVERKILTGPKAAAALSAHPPRRVRPMAAANTITAAQPQPTAPEDALPAAFRHTSSASVPLPFFPVSGCTVHTRIPIHTHTLTTTARATRTRACRCNVFATSTRLAAATTIRTRRM